MRKASLERRLRCHPSELHPVNPGSALSVTDSVIGRRERAKRANSMRFGLSPPRWSGRGTSACRSSRC